MLSASCLIYAPTLPVHPYNT